MLAYYGQAQMLEITETAPFLSDAAIGLVCERLPLAKEALRCYQRKQTLPQTYNC